MQISATFFLRSEMETRSWGQFFVHFGVFPCLAWRSAFVATGHVQVFHSAAIGVRVFLFRLASSWEAPVLCQQRRSHDDDGSLIWGTDR